MNDIFSNWERELRPLVIEKTVQEDESQSNKQFIE